MRSREEIEKIQNSSFDNGGLIDLIVELLLDIRTLLTTNKQEK